MHTCSATGPPRCTPGPSERSHCSNHCSLNIVSQQSSRTLTRKQRQLSFICDFYLFSWGLWWTHAFNWLQKFKIEMVFNGCGQGTHTDETHTHTHNEIHTHTGTDWNNVKLKEKKHLMDTGHHCQQEVKLCDPEKDTITSEKVSRGSIYWLLSIIIIHHVAN